MILQCNNNLGRPTLEQFGAVQCSLKTEAFAAPLLSNDCVSQLREIRDSHFLTDESDSAAS